ncbi:methyl-accepting chemotaxis protein [Curvibacter sp. HBC28]|uniref:Methyl-accepting chemotaxis protein n=1 Tax=Curvibacter microcysteis TaxID=3026419 RepID=A0ABT5MJH8_9BURK|nr:methyl-accepting chemotaxis protein [Curvibacter sp. HBC28]MDD0816740.1 methyl-accepting chemotaxis protein [Curvibacter sp. HBC28]
MRLSLKLPLAFASALAALLAAALFGLFQLNQSINVYQEVVQRDHEHALGAVQLLSDFKVQIQEWKNVLLRGRDDKQRQRYWSAFEKQEAAVRQSAQSLQSQVHHPEARALLQKFSQSHERMGQAYRQGLAAYEAAQFDASAGDRAVTGIDREPAQLLDQATALIRQASEASGAEAARQARASTGISLGVMGLVCVLSGLGAWGFSRSVTAPLGRAVRLSRAVADGDLSLPMHAHGRDELADLLRAMADMQTRLSEVVSQVRAGAEGVAHASAEIAVGNHDLSLRTEQQASALEQTSAAMEQMSATVQNNADNASRAEHVSGDASSTAQRAGQAVQSVVLSVQQMQHSAHRIADITGVIDGIAFQTNILALNAAVEAARAGEQGRGFAVVASEVRVLAQRSAAAAREIKALIQTSHSEVNQGAEVAGQAGQTMTRLVTSIAEVTRLMAEISAASREQSTGVSQIGLAIQQLDQTTQQNAALVEQSAAAAQSLQQQAAELVRSVAFFKTSSANTTQTLPQAV